MNVDDESGGSLCVDCFVEKAENMGIIIPKNALEMDIFYSKKIFY